MSGDELQWRVEYERQMSRQQWEEAVGLCLSAAERACDVHSPMWIGKNE
jgi:hypothetical protein